MVLLTVTAAVVLTATLISVSAVSGTSSGTRTAGDGTDAAAADAVARLLQGIPQRGTVLGDPRAPVTLVEYADLQCPYCAEWATTTFPALVRDYVRPGKLRIEFRGLRFIGPDSERALGVALLAGRRGRLWNVGELFYANQGAEGSGWVTDELLRTTASAAGLDADRVLDSLDDPALEKAMQAAELHAERSGIRGTPAFELGRTGGAFTPLEVTSLGPEEFRRAVESLLAS